MSQRVVNLVYHTFDLGDRLMYLHLTFTTDLSNIFLEPAFSERDIVVTILVQHVCVRCACLCIVHSSGFVWAITCTFMHEFQNNLAQLLSSRSKSVTGI